MCVFQEGTGLYNLGIFVLQTTTQTKTPQSRLNKNGNLLADENEKANRDLFRGLNNVRRTHSLSIVKPTFLHTGLQVLLCS